MKVIINGYEVEFKVRELRQPRASQLDAREFLLYLKRIFVRAKETALNLNEEKMSKLIEKDIDNITKELLNSGDRRVD